MKNVIIDQNSLRTVMSDSLGQLRINVFVHQDNVLGIIAYMVIKQTVLSSH